MAMNFTETNASIYSSAWFRDRVRIALSHYVNYLLNTPTDDPEYQPKIDAATRMTQQYEAIVAQLMFTLSGDVEVQEAGPSISDATLQMIVEKTVKKYYPVIPAPAFMAGYPPPPRPSYPV